MLIWHYFTKPKFVLATILQSPKYYFGKNNYFMLKSQMIFWHILTKLKHYVLTLVLHILNLSLMENIITHPLKNTFLTRFIKAHECHPWQNYSFCRDNQAQGSLTTKPNSHINSSNQRSHELTSQNPAQLNSWSLFPSSPNLSNQIKKGHVSIRG